MELSKEAKWFEQQELFRQSVLLNIEAKKRDIDGYKKQIELLKKSIDIDTEFLANIDSNINRIKKEWQDGK